MPFKIFLVIMLSLAPWWNSWAQENAVSGEISVAPMQVDIRGNRAKFNESRDLRDGVHGHVRLRCGADKTYLDFSADDIGYGGQKYELDGGRRESFGYHLSYDEIPHHFSFGHGPPLKGKPFVP
jgi:hypothetical protein